MSLRIITARVRVFWESLSTSYWFIPVLMMLGSVALCYTCLSVIERAFLPDFLQPLIPRVTPENVQQLLSTVAGAMITFTSIAFSMTLVALTLASNQFGPRLIRNFMNDKSTQAVLGIMVSTFLFCLLSLHHLSSIAENQDAISLLAGFTVFFAIVDCVTIVYFIHHVSRSIQADQVIANCFNAFCSSIDSLLPKPESDSAHKAVNESWTSTQESFPLVLHARCSGYVQTINYASFMAMSAVKVSGSEIHVRSGDHVVKDAKLITLYCKQPFEADAFSDLHNAVVLGSERTPIQDPEFAVSQLVEIALRALSPGINDPHTAITCIDKLTAACVLICQRDFPADTLVHNSTEVWLKRRTFTFEGIVDTAFSQIRQMAGSHTKVQVHLLNSLATLQSHCNALAVNTIMQHANSIYANSQTNTLCGSDRHAIDEAMLPFRRQHDV